MLPCICFLYKLGAAVLATLGGRSMALTALDLLYTALHLLMLPSICYRLPSICYMLPSILLLRQRASPRVA
jgi:hypothetical protein